MSDVNDDPEIAALRARIDAVDAELARLVAARVAIVREIAAWKAARGVPLLDPDRERAIIARAAAESALPEDAARAAFEGILAACKTALAAKHGT